MKKKLIKGVYNWAFLLILMAVLIFVNIISSYRSFRIDMTEDKRFSVAESTKKFLEETENFSGRLNLRIYLEGELPAELRSFRDAVEDKLKECKVYAGNRIEYQFINPNVGTDDEKNELFQSLYDEGRGIIPMDVVYMKDGSQSQLRIWPGAIIDYGGSDVDVIQLLPGSRPQRPYQLAAIPSVTQNAINNLEYILISGMRRATKEYRPRIAFLQGHGELNPQETMRVRNVLSQYYSIREVTLNDSIHALDGVDGLIIARPTEKFSDKDIYLIDQFVMKGGSLMCFLDKLSINEDTLMQNGQVHTTRYDLGLDRMLFDYGIKIHDNLIMDVSCAPKSVPLREASMIPWFYHVLTTPTKHPIARNLEPVSLEYANEIQFVQNSPNVALSPVLTSSTNSTATGMAPLVSLMLPTTYGKNPQLAPNPTSETNKKCVAGLAEGMFESYFKNRIVAEFANDPDAGFEAQSTKEGKVFVVGNGRFLANSYDTIPDRTAPNGYRFEMPQFNELRYSGELLQMNFRHFFGNQEFFQNLTDYMLGDNSVLDIRSRQIDIRQIDKEKVKRDAGFYKMLNLTVPIGIILLLAMVMNYLRKRKFAH